MSINKIREFSFHFFQIFLPISQNKAGNFNVTKDFKSEFLKNQVKSNQYLISVRDNENNR